MVVQFNKHCQEQHIAMTSLLHRYSISQLWKVTIQQAQKVRLFTYQGASVNELYKCS